jgi:hypothetical protein
MWLHEFGLTWTRSTRDLWIYSKPTCTCNTPVLEIRRSEWSCVTIRLGTEREQGPRPVTVLSGRRGGLPVHRVISTQCQVSVVPMGTWPMGDSEGLLWVVRISSHITVCLIGSPLEQGCSLIIFLLSINTHERETTHSLFQDLNPKLLIKNTLIFCVRRTSDEVFGNILSKYWTL